MPIAWGVVAQIAAEAMAEGLGKSIGEGLGSAFVDSLLGKKGDDGMTEVALSLDRLEQKLDALTAFVTQKLPQLIYDLTLDAQLEVIKAEIPALRTSVLGLLAGYKAANSDAAAHELHEAIVELLNRTQTLMGFGVPAYPIALEVMTLAIATYTELIERDEVRYRPVLQVRAEAWKYIVDSWLKPANGSLTTTLASYQESLLTAQGVIAAHPNGIPFFLLAVFGPVTVDTAKEPPDSIFANVNPPVVFHQYQIFIGFLDRQYPDGAWTGGQGEVFWQQHTIENAPPLSEGSWGPLLDQSPSATGQLPIQVPWWTPLRSWAPGTRPDEVRDQAGRAYTSYQRQVASLPPLIADLGSAIATITSLRETCASLTKQ